MPISMPVAIPMPKAIGLLDYHFKQNASADILTAMLNKKDKDYSVVEELFDVPDLAQYTQDEIREGVAELYGRKFLLKVTKPYGCVYAVNKLYISMMEFVYGG